MSEFNTPTLRRRKDGSLDIAAYEVQARQLRSARFHELAASKISTSDRAKGQAKSQQVSKGWRGLLGIFPRLA